MRRNIIVLCSLLLCFGNITTSLAQSVDEIIAKYTTAVGGLDKIKAVKTEKTVLTLETGGMTINQTIYRKRPGMLREETLLQGKTSLQIYNGTEGWVLNPFTGRETVEAMPEDDIKEMKIQADMDGELIDYAKKGYKVTYEGEEDVDGAMAYKLKLITDKNDVIIFFIDKDSGYLVKQTFKQKNEDGSESEYNMLFSNFKTVDGRVVPFEMESIVTYMGQVYKTPVKIISIEFNKEMSDDLFKKPEIKN
jgi:outer membrane lipoprotein-sorting protein